MLDSVWTASIFDPAHPTAYGRALFRMTPFRPDIMHALSVQTWANLEIGFAFAVLVMGFMQKASDGTQSTTGPLGGLSYVFLVWKTGFSFLVLLDGAYTSVHADVEQARPVATMAMATIASQQLRQILMQWAIRQVVKGNRFAAMLIGGPRLLESAKGAAYTAMAWARRH